MEPDVKNCTSMDEVWRILDEEYGKAINIYGEAVGDLTKMVQSGPTDTHKFIELYRK